MKTTITIEEEGGKTTVLTFLAHEYAIPGRIPTISEIHEQDALTIRIENQRDIQFADRLHTTTDKDVSIIGTLSSSRVVHHAESPERVLRNLVGRAQEFVSYSYVHRDSVHSADAKRWLDEVENLRREV